MEKTRTRCDTDLTDFSVDPCAVDANRLVCLQTFKAGTDHCCLISFETGCQWRNLAHDLHPWKTVYSFFMRAKKPGLWESLRNHLVEIIRENADRSPAPSFAIVDSQSIKATSATHERGYDCGKKN